MTTLENIGTEKVMLTHKEQCEKAVLEQKLADYDNTYDMPPYLKICREQVIKRLKELDK